MANVFKQNYQNLDNLYCDYVMGEDYRNNALVKEVNKLSDSALEDAINFLKLGKSLDAEDSMIQGAVVHEELGFLLGFSYAMKIMQESVKNI
jgi:hypothetical protein